VAAGPITSRNLVARVLSDNEGKRRVDELLFAQKQRAMALLIDNRDVVEALRDALIERDELVGEEIIEVIRVALARRGEPVPDPPVRA
jgi:cell division protease FtsH